MYPPPQHNWQQGGPSPSYPQYQQGLVPTLGTSSNSTPSSTSSSIRHHKVQARDAPPCHQGMHGVLHRLNLLLPVGYPGQPQYGAQQQQPQKPFEVGQGYPAAPPPPAQQPNYDPEAAEVGSEQNTLCFAECGTVLLPLSSTRATCSARLRPLAVPWLITIKPRLGMGTWGLVSEGSSGHACRRHSRAKTGHGDMFWFCF